MDTRNRDNMKTFEKSFIKNQSAMEYLMTYGWSILIIAVVLGALSFLGIFNPLTFAPKATAGNCQVVKNAQLGVSNLVGSCNNQVPQYVAQFNGKSSFINTTLEFPYGAQQNFTLSVWVYQAGLCTNGGYCGVIDSDNGTNGWGLTSFKTNEDFWILSSVSGAQQDMYITIPSSGWFNIITTYQYVNGNYVANGYINGAGKNLNALRSPIKLPIPYKIQIGIARNSDGMVFDGMLSNIQLYNTSLSSNDVKLLYQEGIGGVPINPQNIVAWYPLNGNANDYSGNNNNGVPTNVVFTSSWFGGYTQP
jgi:hypothetical protein